MSAIDSFLLSESTKSFPLKVQNISASVIRTLANESISSQTLQDKSVLVSHSRLNITDSDSVITEDLFVAQTGGDVSKRIRDNLGNTSDILEQISTTTIKILSDASPEVRSSRPEVPENSGLGTAEHVVIGACVLIVVLACLAIILRIVMPIVRPRLKQKHDDWIDDESVGRKSSGISGGFTNFGAETDSHSSGCESNQSQDWSEVSSDQTRSTDADEKPADMAGNYGQLRRHPNLAEDFRGSSSSLPTYLSTDKEKRSTSKKTSPMQARRLNADLVSVISSQSLEPLRMEDSYRNRWDDQWDPYGSLPRGNLSHLSHPSESRISLSSKSTTSVQSNARFPTPSREQVHKIKMDNERRYPSKSSQENIRIDKSARR